MMAQVKIWALIITLNYGTPQARDVTAAENIKSWGECIMLGAKFLRAFKPPVSVTCQPADVKA